MKKKNRNYSAANRKALFVKVKGGGHFFLHFCLTAACAKNEDQKSNYFSYFIFFIAAAFIFLTFLF